MTTEDLVDSVLGSAPLRVLASAATRGKLRVLGYHGVDRPEVLDRQLAWLVRHFVPVRGADVVDAARGGRPLPRNAVWVTFDDGLPSVVERGQAVLDRHGVPATMFVCPGLLDTDVAHWWHGIDAGEVARLKTIPDAERRAAIAPASAAQLTSQQLRAWVVAGHEVGNHTVDHPMLDRCDDAEQRRQVVDAHERLCELLDVPPTTFAYPNGNAAPAAARALRDLDYGIAVLHDHRLATLEDPLHVSRLRAGDHVTDARFRAIAAGTHPALLAIRRGRARGAAPRAGAA